MSDIMSNKMSQAPPLKKAMAITGGYTQVLNWFISSPEFDPYEKVVCMVIAKCEMNRGKSWPSIKTIAREANCSETRVKKAIDKLIKSGVLFKKHIKGTKSNVYKTIIRKPP